MVEREEEREERRSLVNKIAMVSWAVIKAILIPPSKGDIKMRCEMATHKNEEFEQEECCKDLVEDSCTEDKFDSRIFKFRNAINSFFRKEKDHVVFNEELEEDEYYITSPLDAFIGYAVDVAGSITVLIIVFALLIGWIIWGCLTGAGDTWQIVMQDGQSIQTYVWNTFLMRQQLDGTEKFLLLYGKLKSRSNTEKRLIERIVENRKNNGFDFNIYSDKVDEFEKRGEIEFKSKSMFDKVSDLVGKVVGSLPTVVLYWMGIFAWVGCGAIPINEGTVEEPQMNTFSNTWQMYVNTATAIELLITTVFLENIRGRSSNYILKQTQTFNELDSDLEYLLRDINKDYYENDLVIVKRNSRDKIQKLISLYAHIVGNGLGLIISICVFSAWLGIGNTMKWNSNWWLIIGTYTGLMGFIDGFALREIFFSITNYESEKYRDLLKDSQDMIDLLGLPIELEPPKKKMTLSDRISIYINRICSNKYSVVFAVVVVLGLIILASGLRWSETAQIICNTPTMIIEGFFLLILVQAHDWANEERIEILSELTRSRVIIHDYITKNSRC